MKLNNQNSIQFLSNNILNYFDIQQYKDIIPFCLQDVSLEEDISAASDRINLEKYPYMVKPLQFSTIQKNKRKQMVVSWPEQFGKSTLQYLSILYNCCYNTLQSILLYPSQELAAEMNMVKFVPLFKNLPQFRQELDKPFCIRSDRLKLSNAVIYFSGAGQKCVGKSAKLVLGDECSIWDCPNADNIIQLKKRIRSYDESLAIFVSSPRYKQDSFWRQFLNSSQGYYTLRCSGCGKLTMRSCDLFNLQFESIYNEQQKIYKVKRGTCKMVCPECGYEHGQSERQKMIKEGDYVHAFPQRQDYYAGFQCGVLASMANVYDWDSIADVQLASGKTATLEDYMNLDNSYRGLPLQQHNYNKQDETSLSKHFYNAKDLKIEDIEAIVVSSDTQATFSVYAVTALTKQNNYYVLECGRVRYLFLDEEERKIINQENKRNEKQPQRTLLDILNSEYCGIKPLCLLVDHGGNRSDQIKNFSKIQRNILLYKGTSLKFDSWKISETYNKLFLCDFKKSLAQFIFMLHYQKSKESNFLFLPLDLTEKDIAQILAFQPDNTKRNGNLFQNYVCEDRVHDMADTIRMSIMAFKIASRIYRKERFIHGEARILNLDKNPLKKEKQKPKIKFNTAPRKPLFYNANRYY